MRRKFIGSFMVAGFFYVSNGRGRLCTYLCMRNYLSRESQMKFSIRCGYRYNHVVFVLSSKKTWSKIGRKMENNGWNSTINWTIGEIGWYKIENNGWEKWTKNLEFIEIVLGRGSFNSGTSCRRHEGISRREVEDHSLPPPVFCSSQGLFALWNNFM